MLTQPETKPMIYYDNTRLSDFKECPRKYFYRHVRHWRRSGTSYALIFGLSWHEAMDVVWGLTGKTDDEKVLALAMEAFMREWQANDAPREEEMDDEMRKKLSPRLPSTAIEMIWNYIQSRGPMIKECEVLNIERPFAVPLDPSNPNLLYIGRLDKEIRYRGRVIFIEHKTTTAYSKDHDFLLDYQNSWTPNSQIDGYLHTGHMLYGNEMKAVYVDAALIHKVHHDKFKFIPVERHLTALDDWQNDTLYYIEEIEAQKAAFADGQRRGIFVKNSQSCHGKYGACSYIDLCKFVSKPLELTETPEGCIKEKWSPFETLGMQKLGLPAEREVGEDG